MPVRDYTSGGVIRTAVGSADPTGALTFVALVKFKGGGDITDWMIARQDASHASAVNWESFGFEAGFLRTYPGVGAGSTPPTNEWLLVAASKSAGSSKAVISYYRFSNKTWTHLESSSAFTSAHTGTPAEIQLGRWQGGEQFNGRYAAAMVYDKALSKAEVEALATAVKIEAWLSTSPLALWTFSQKEVTEPVIDLTGNGADQISIVGTTVAEEEPPIPYGNVIYNDSPSGTITSSGSKTESWSTPPVDLPDQGLSIGGGRARLRSAWAYKRGVQLSLLLREQGKQTKAPPTRPQSWINWFLGQSFHSTVTGSVTLSGSKTESLVFNDSRSGSITLSGYKAQSYSATDNRSGTIVLSALSVESYTSLDSRSGTISVTSSKSEIYIGTDELSGTVALFGSAAESDFTSDLGYVVVKLEGSKTETSVCNDFSTGIIDLTGSAVELAIGNDFSTGVVNLTGSAVELAIGNDFLTGIVDLTGSAVEDWDRIPFQAILPTFALIIGAEFETGVVIDSDQTKITVMAQERKAEVATGQTSADVKSVVKTADVLGREIETGVNSIVRDKDVEINVDETKALYAAHRANA